MSNIAGRSFGVASPIVKGSREATLQSANQAMSFNRGSGAPTTKPATHFRYIFLFVHLRSVNVGHSSGNALYPIHRAA